jgi:hypothetical protein
MRWSLTKLKTAEQCLQKYKFRYIDRIQEERGEAAERGVGKHAIIEGYIRGDLKELSPDLSFYQTFLDGIKKHDYVRPEHKVALKLDLAPCSWDDPEAWYTGVLDLKVVSGDIGYVYDWKTGKIYPDHDEQKELYALATFAEHQNLQEVQTFHVYLDLGKTRQRTYFRTQVSGLWDGWRQRVSILEEKDSFIPNPGFHCRWCSYSKSKGGPCKF